MPYSWHTQVSSNCVLINSEQGAECFICISLQVCGEMEGKVIEVNEYERQQWIGFNLSQCLSPERCVQYLAFEYT